MNRYFLILPLLALLGVAGFSLIRQKEIAGLREKEGRMDGRVSEYRSAGEDSLMEIGDTKHRIRPDHPKQSIEGTEELLRTTIIPVVDFPAGQSFSECLKQLNRLIQEAGIDPHQLRISLRRNDPFHQFSWEEELRLRNHTVAEVLLTLIGRTVMRWQVGENGLVQIMHATEIEYEPPLEEVVPEKKEPWTGEVDAFGEPVREYDDCDPFAEK